MIIMIAVVMVMLVGFPLPYPTLETEHETRT